MKHHDIAMLGLVLTIMSCIPFQKSNELSQDQLLFIRTETINGKLDFEKQFEPNSLYLLDEIAYNYKEAAVYSWGKAICNYGVTSSKEAINLYEEIKNVKLEDHYIKAIKNGYKNCNKIK